MQQVGAEAGEGLGHGGGGPGIGAGVALEASQAVLGSRVSRVLWGVLADAVSSPTLSSQRHSWVILAYVSLLLHPPLWLCFFTGLSSTAIVASQQGSAPSLYPPPRR